LFLSKVFTQRRQEAKAQSQKVDVLGAFAPLRLCVKLFWLRLKAALCLRGASLEGVNL